MMYGNVFTHYIEGKVSVDRLRMALDEVLRKNLENKGFDKVAHSRAVR